MKLNQRLVNRIKVTEHDHNRIELINIKTGAIEQTIVTGKQFVIELDEHRIVATIGIPWHTRKGTHIQANIQFDLNKFNLPKFAVLLAKYKEIEEANKDTFAHIDLNDLERQRQERYDARCIVEQEEERYIKQLLKADFKRIAKENVDAKRPPVTAMITAPVQIDEGM